VRQESAKLSPRVRFSPTPIFHIKSMPLSRRQFLTIAGLSLLAGKTGIDASITKSPDRIFTNRQEYLESLPRVFEGNPDNPYTLFLGYPDWSPEKLQDPNNFAVLQPTTFLELLNLDSNLPDFINTLSNLINSNSELLAQLFRGIPEFLYGDMNLFLNLPPAGHIRLANAGDSNNSFFHNDFDYHVATFHRIPHQLYRFDPHDAKLRRVLNLIDPTQILTMKQLLDTTPTAELEFGNAINQGYDELINGGWLAKMVESRNPPNIVHFTLGKIDFAYLGLGNTFDLGRFYLNARKGIEYCLAHNVIPVIILPNILDANREAEGYFVANPKGLAICYVLYQLALQFNIPLINQYPSLRNVRPIRVVTDRDNYVVGAYGTGFIYTDAQHYSRPGSDPFDISARPNMDVFFSTIKDFHRRYGDSAIIWDVLRFYSNLIDMGVFNFL
ncbi:MAG: hypothetical protein ABI721_05320, partial [Candidatus Dojkabacteria bacterium]